MPWHISITRFSGKLSADALCVIGANDGGRAWNEGAVSKVPHDVVVPVNLDHAVVELIGDEDIAGFVETTFVLVALRERARGDDR